MSARAVGIRLATLTLAALASCTPAPRNAQWASVLERTPAFLAGESAFDPSIAVAPRGRVALTWVTRDTLGADAWISVSADSGAHFGAAKRLNLRPNSVSSFPESRPVAVFGPSGQLVVAWAGERDSVRFTDDIVTRASADGGETFGPEVVANDDRSRPGPAYHGFVSLDLTPRGRLLATWIDGRSAPLSPGEEEPSVAEIWAAHSDDAGATWSPNARVAGGVCPCCRPALHAGAGAVAIAYRGVRDSVRDPRLAISSDEGSTFGIDTLVSADGWRLAGCPVAGPALTLARDGGWICWYSGAGGREGIHAVRWNTQGGLDGPAIALDDSLRDGAHPLLASMGPVTLAGMIARAGPARRVFALRSLGQNRERSPWLLLGANARSAALAVQDARSALAAWIEQTESGPRLRLVQVTKR